MTTLSFLELDARPYTSTTLANLEIMTTEVFDSFCPIQSKKLPPKMLVSTCKGVHLSHMLHRHPGTNPHKWFKYDDGEVTKAKMDNYEVCMCVISLVCERQCLCTIILVIVSNHVQAQCVIDT